ncbi:facilitated trehalose transporter Tret1-like isoform X2 [Leptidea sinapis]|uniref:facilitated trehalose transporter Tret1-like isoform X2 n=1 Tax=Leptidea sinapis TaxID=189913 RepID=UPI0021410075|nr:facilitated trehalose transporter Tret1-like isoform X2 [Leptidea sinapis]
MSPFCNQLFVAASPLLSALSSGGLIGYPSVLLQQFKQNDSSIHIDVDTSSWIASIHGLAGIPSLFIPYIMQHRGRKFGYHICCLLVMLGWTIIYFAKNATTVIIGESFQGLGAKSLLVVSYMAISEMGHPRYRNILMLFYTTSQTIGVTSVHIMGAYIYWKTICIVMLLPVVFAFFMSCFWPESPAWLAHKGRFEESKKSFIWLRGTDEESVAEMNALLDAQKSYILKKKTNIYGKRNHFARDAWEKISSKDFYVPATHMFLLLSVYYWSGNLVFLVYAMNMIENVTKDESSAFVAMIVMDLVTLLGNTVAFIFFKHFKNKTVLLTSGIGSAFFLLASAIASFLQFDGSLSRESLLCLYFLVGFMIASSLGIYTTPYVMASEIMPMRHRGIGGSLMVIIICSSYSFTLKIAPYLVLYLKLHGTFLLYAITLSVCLIWVWMFVPETKNETLQNIERHFIDTNINDSTNLENDEAEKLNLRVVL